MEAEQPIAATSPKLYWLGWILTGLPALMLIFSAGMKLAKPAPVLTEFARLGYEEGTIIGIGILELACALIYLFPRTAVLGAILVTAYLGGAVATHVRVGDPFIPPAIVGVFVWAGLYLRDKRIRDLLPLRG